MARKEGLSRIMSVIVAAALAGCGGTVTAKTGVADHGDASVGGAGGSGGSFIGRGPGGSISSAGTGGGSRLVACRDGTGSLDCCPPGATSGAACAYSGTTCSTPCTNGMKGHLLCSGGAWIAGRGLFPCRSDAGSDGSVSQLSCADLRMAWSSFASSHAGCSVDADCTTFEAYDNSLSPCDSPPGLNRALNRQSVADAQPYVTRYFERACGGDANTLPNAKNGLWSDFGYDGSALRNPRCVGGSCTAESISCNPGPGDRGPRECPDFDESQCPVGRCQLLPRCNATPICSPTFSGPPPSCGGVGYYGAAVACCPGLMKRCGEPLSDGSCNPDAADTTFPMCLTCGDGTCEAALENRCNCPEDCP